MGKKSKFIPTSPEIEQAAQDLQDILEEKSPDGAKKQGEHWTVTRNLLRDAEVREKFDALRRLIREQQKGPIVIPEP